MKAIVLTFDDNAIFTEHMIAKYAELWPGNPFEFVIPYQNRKLVEAANKTFVRSPVNIRATVLHLLDQVPDDEWIFWCIDDWYPTRFDIANIRKIHQLITENRVENIDGINFCVSHKKARKERAYRLKMRDGVHEIENFKAIELHDYDQIWLHQFIRAGVLRYFFENIPEPKKGAKEMDWSKRNIAKPDTHTLLLMETDFAEFGESTSGGKITKNCLLSLGSMGLKLDDERISLGQVSKDRMGKINSAKVIINKILKLISR